MFDHNSQDVALGFLLFYIGVLMLNFSIGVSKGSLLTGKIWPHGLWQYITGWSLSLGQMQKKNLVHPHCGLKREVVTEFRWSLRQVLLCWTEFP